MRAALSKELFPILGNSVQSFRGNVERYSTPVGKWKLHTWVDTGKRYSQFSYNHTVTARQNVDLTEGMSILVWLGIAPTDWDLLTNDADIRSAAKLVAELCAHFIVAVSNMQRKRQRRTFVSRR